jgi:hypothetical protein
MGGFINGIARDGVPVQVATRLAIHGAALGILEAVHLVAVVDPAGIAWLISSLIVPAAFSMPGP